MLSIRATVSLAASSGRQRITRSTSSISARYGARILALVVRNALFHDVALQSETLTNAEARGPAAPSTNTMGFVEAAATERCFVSEEVMARSFRVRWCRRSFGR